MGWICSMHEEAENGHKILVKILKGRDNLGDIAANDRIILKAYVKYILRVKWLRI